MTSEGYRGNIQWKKETVKGERVPNWTVIQAAFLRWGEKQHLWDRKVFGRRELKARVAIPAFGGKLGKIYARFYGNIKGISVFTK